MLVVLGEGISLGHSIVMYHSKCIIHIYYVGVKVIVWDTGVRLGICNTRVEVGTWDTRVKT